MEQVEKATVLYIKGPNSEVGELSFEDYEGEIEVNIVTEVLTSFSLDKVEELIDKYEPTLVFIDSHDFEEVYEIAVGTFKDLGVDFQFSDSTCIPTWDFDPDEYEQ